MLDRSILPVPRLQTMSRRVVCVHSASETFLLMEDRVLAVNINQRLALSDIAQAHEALESGETTGSTILTP